MRSIGANVTLVDTAGPRRRGESRSPGIVAGRARIPGGLHHLRDRLRCRRRRLQGGPLRGWSGGTASRLAEKWARAMRSRARYADRRLSRISIIVGGTLQGTTAFNFTHILDMQATHAVANSIDALPPKSGVRTLEVTEQAEDAVARQTRCEKHVDHQQFYEDCTPGFLNNEGDFKRQADLRRRYLWRGPAGLRARHPAMARKTASPRTR
jgi:cyclohexanone monooxygenase